MLLLIVGHPKGSVGFWRPFGSHFLASAVQKALQAPGGPLARAATWEGALGSEEKLVLREILLFLSFSRAHLHF